MILTVRVLGSFASLSCAWWQVNDVVRQETTLDKLMWKTEEILSRLSALCTLKAGDLIFTGTPAGVSCSCHGHPFTQEITGIGALHVGDVVRASIEGLSDCLITVAPPVV
jgi:fumarylpyruvate hydrolase